MKEVGDSSRNVDLERADLPIVDGDQDCTGVGAGFNANLMLCAGYADGHVSILPGDSGGPLIVDNKVVGPASWSRSDFTWYSVYGRLNNAMGDWAQAEVNGTDPTPTASPTSQPTPRCTYPDGSPLPNWPPNFACPQW